MVSNLTGLEHAAASSVSAIGSRAASGPSHGVSITDLIVLSSLERMTDSAPAYIESALKALFPDSHAIRDWSDEFAALTYALLAARSSAMFGCAPAESFLGLERRTNK